MRSHHSGVAIPSEAGVRASLPLPSATDASGERPIVGEFGARVDRAGRIERRVLAFAPVAIAAVGLSALLLSTTR